jgi:hypothetical protein
MCLRDAFVIIPLRKLRAHRIYLCGGPSAMVIPTATTGLLHFSAIVLSSVGSHETTGWGASAIETRSQSSRLLLWALVPVSIWACALKAIDHFYGLHSTLGTWAAYIGSPGLIVGGLTIRLIGSESVFYVGVFLGNWLFFFCIIKAALALRNRLRSL